MKFPIGDSLVLAFIPVLLAGCFGGDEGRTDLPETVEASGIVTLNGKPVPGASIVAAPVGGENPAKALTDEDGHFSLEAFRSKEGAVPGTYKVAVKKTVGMNAKGKILTQEEITASGTHGASGSHDASTGITWKNIIPETYANPNSSGLEIEIPKEGTTSIQIELKE